MSAIREKMHGLIGFPVTPFHQDLSLDLEALEENVEEVAAHPFCAINAPAGISEAFSLTPDEAVEVVRKTVEVTAGRMPVIGCVCYSAPLAAAMAKRMEQDGADALLVLPPYYANAPMDGLIAYYKTVGEASGLPLAVYSRGWAAFKPDEVARLADAAPTLEIWKDGQADARAYQRIMAKVGDRLAWIGGAGDDSAAMYTAIGINCYTSSISAVAPKLALTWGEAAMAKDFPRLNELINQYVHPLWAIRVRKRGYEVVAMKKARELIGKRAGPARPPLPELAPDDLADLEKVIATWQPFLD
ncbi:MAG: hypothetical protein GY953_19670 [bacterium]|nr:hypothetical protein [bacterium]